MQWFGIWRGRLNLSINDGGRKAGLHSVRLKWSHIFRRVHIMVGSQHGTNGGWARHRIKVLSDLYMCQGKWCLDDVCLHIYSPLNELHIDLLLLPFFPYDIYWPWCVVNVTHFCHLATPCSFSDRRQLTSWARNQVDKILYNPGQQQLIKQEPQREITSTFVLRFCFCQHNSGHWTRTTGTPYPWTCVLAFLLECTSCKSLGDRSVYLMLSV